MSRLSWEEKQESLRRPFCQCGVMTLYSVCTASQTSLIVIDRSELCGSIVGNWSAPYKPNCFIRTCWIFSISWKLIPSTINITLHKTQGHTFSLFFIFDKWSRHTFDFKTYFTILIWFFLVRTMLKRMTTHLYYTTFFVKQCSIVFPCPLTRCL